MVSAWRLAGACIATLLVLTSTFPAGADSGEVEVGQFVRFGTAGVLTESHLSKTTSSITVDGPESSSTLKVNQQYLRENLGDWASTTSFTIDSESRIVVQGEDAAFERLRLGSDPAFTVGSAKSVQLLERPMWMSIRDVRFGEGFTLELDDGDSSGQQIRVSKQWLDSMGMHIPLFVHEDGQTIAYVKESDPPSYILDVPHFSLIFVEVSDAGPVVKGRQGALIFDHAGEVRQRPLGGEIEIDVAQQILEYDVLIPKQWIDLRIANAVAVGHPWGREIVDGTEYYVVGLLPSHTPATLTVHAESWEVFAVELSLDQLIDNIIVNLTATLPIMDGNLTFGVLLNQTPLSIATDANGADLEEPVRISFIEDTTASENGIGADVIVSSLWLGGDLRYQNRTYSYAFDHIDPSSTNASLMVYHRKITDLPSAGGAYPGNPPAPGNTKDVFGRTHLEPSFCNAFSNDENAAGHVGGAYTTLNEMFPRYTGVTITNHFAICEDNPIPMHTNTYYGTCSRMLLGFGEWVDDQNVRQYTLTSNLFYALISGNPDMLKEDPSVGEQPNSCYGVALSDGIGKLAPNPDSLHYGLDDSVDYYKGRSTYRHLAILMAQEIAHNWGEPNHPCAGYPRPSPEESSYWTFSVMCDKVPFSYQDPLWMDYDHEDRPAGTTPSADRVITGTNSYTVNG